MSGFRLNSDLLSDHTGFEPELIFLVDKESTDWIRARKLNLADVGNTYIQGSTNGSNWHDEITSSDIYFRITTDGGDNWRLFNTDFLPEGSNEYFTESKVLAIDSIVDVISDRHTHSNKSILDNIVNNGDGSSFLANDGTYSADVYKVGIDTDSTPSFLGVANDDGVLRVDTTLDYTDGGNYITLGLDSSLKSNYDDAYTHISSNGSDHSYINQDVTSSGSPTFVSISGDIANFGNISGGNYTSIESDGTIKFNGDATVFDDESRDITSIEVTGTEVSINSTELSVDFTDTAQLNDYAYTNFQFKHARKLDTIIYPHVHWTQESSDIPNFLVQYRWQVNGQSKVTTWSNYILDTNAFTYVSGSLNQISYGSGIAAPTIDGISGILQVRLIRDTDNDSTEFTVADAYTGTVQVTELDIHYEIDTIGSREEYTK